MKRIFVFDLMRAVAIIGVVFVHAFLHEWSQADAVEGGSQEPSVMVLILFYLLTMAGLFYVVMGAVNAYMMYNRIKSKRNTIRQMVISGIIMGIFLLSSHYFFRALLSADSGVLYYLIHDGEWTTPEPKWIIGTCTLAMLGYTSITIPIVLGLLFRNRGYEKQRRNYLILLISGTLILAITPLLRDAFARNVVHLIDTGQYIPAIIAGAFVYDLFPIFPYVAYGLYGAILGIALARGEKKSIILGVLLLGGVFWLVLGFLGNNIYGGLDPTLYRDFTHAAIYNKTFQQYSQIGFFMIATMLGLMLFDFISEERKSKRHGYFKFIRRFSMISLTIFLFEGLVMASFRTVMDAIPYFDGWDDSLAIIAAVALGHVYLWAQAAKQWEKIGYVGSVEWAILKVIGWLSGKRSEKFNIHRNRVIEEIPSKSR